MHPDTRKVATHMRRFGLTALGRAAYQCTFSENGAPYAHAMAVVHAAHGAELVVKARIADEHPLLIFSSWPRSSSTQDLLTIAELFQKGKTIQYSDLPEALWAATGIRMKRRSQFEEFGQYRNAIMHFSVPEGDWASVCLKFLFEVVEPLVQQFWSDSIMPYASEWDEVTVSDGYLERELKRAGVRVTKELRAALDAE